MRMLNESDNKMSNHKHKQLNIKTLCLKLYLMENFVTYVQCLSIVALHVNKW